MNTEPLPDPVPTLTLEDASEELRKAFGNDIYKIAGHVRSLVAEGKLPLFNGGRRIHGNSITIGMIGIIARYDIHNGLAQLVVEPLKACDIWFYGKSTLGRAEFEEYLRDLDEPPQSETTETEVVGTKSVIEAEAVNTELPTKDPLLEAPKPKNKGGRPTLFPADEIIARAFVSLAQNGRLPPQLTGEDSLVEKVAFEFNTKETLSVVDRLADVLREPYNIAKELLHRREGN